MGWMTQYKKALVVLVTSKKSVELPVTKMMTFSHTLNNNNKMCVYRGAANAYEFLGEQDFDAG